MIEINGKKILTIKDIIKDPAKILKQKTAKVNFPLTEEAQLVINKMHDYLVTSRKEEFIENDLFVPAVGIAAPQINSNLKICLCLLNDESENEKIITMINPKIIGHSENFIYLPQGEACLSIEKEYKGYVHRYYKILVTFQDINGLKKSLKLTGYNSIIVQHEIDHLNGVLYYTHINETDPFKIIPNSIPWE